MERLRISADGVPPLVTFVERLKTIVSGQTAEQLRLWVDTVAGGLGIEARTLSDLRATGRHSRTGHVFHDDTERAAESMVTERRRPRPRRTDETGMIWGGVPIRNRNF